MMDPNTPDPSARTTKPQPARALTVPLSRHASSASTVGPISLISATSSTPILQHSTSKDDTISTTTEPGHANNSTTEVDTQTVSSPAVTPSTSLVRAGTQQNQNGIGPSTSSSASAVQHNDDQKNDDFEEWRSWKIHWLYLSFLLLVTTLFIVSISVLTIISRRDNGFARESQPPGFLERNPGLRKAIWEQGIFYTALPAFIMTVHRTMWDASIMSFADRQPFVDLLKRDGRVAKRTILLDYKMEPILYRWILAYQNNHLALSACMLSSLVLSFGIVPLTSFLFIMDTSKSNSNFPLTVDTYFNGTIVPQIPSFGNMPNLRLVLDTAASFHLHNLGLPQGTDGTFAFPHFTPQTDLASSTLTVPTDAYGVSSGCVEIPASEYKKTITQKPNSKQMSIQVDTFDRLCAVTITLDIRTSLWSPNIFTQSKHTSCSHEAGSSRVSVLAARYDKPSETVQNLTFISCKTSYFSTSGELVERSEPKLSPYLLYFNEYQKSRSELDLPEIGTVRTFLELEIHNFYYVDVGEEVDGNEFSRNIYHMAEKTSSNEPLTSEALVNATGNLFETVYAAFASRYLFKERKTRINGTGDYVIEEKRLFVQPVIAYVILGVLGVTALLNVRLFYSAKDKSILREEPFGILSYAGIVHNSEHIKKLVSDTAEGNDDPRRAREKAKEIYKLDGPKPKHTWEYNSKEGKIMFKGTLEMQSFSTI
ncbi:hypothetical protein GQ44DRAFT_780446 [Phaeosphaeriaceae sp. PMI808]|nr:hypothetical protein GQ44DRAFT_780446 [Phaeosphaeriaceae sp. PMI808]